MEIKTKILNNRNKKEIVVSFALIDTIYKIIRETYMNSKEIYIDNPTKANNNRLGEFLTYILAYPKDVETPKVIVKDNYIALNNNLSNEF